jgi:hypothetical protein
MTEITGVEQLLGLPKMTIQQCQLVAKRLGFDTTTFDLCGPKGKLKAKWLDAHLGMFQTEDSKGFMMVNQWALAPDVWCENVMVKR